MIDLPDPLAWIRDGLKKPGKTQAGLAKALGRAPSAVTALLKDGRQLKAAEIPVVAAYLEVQPPSFTETDVLGIRMVQVRGVVQAGAWAESWEWAEDDRYSVPIPDDPALRGFTLTGVETRGPSMNRRYPEKTVVIITDYVERGENLSVGKRYVVERERVDGLREATVKTLWQDANGALWLLPESEDPRFQEPIAISGAEGDTIRIVGRVVYAVQREE